MKNKIEEKIAKFIKETEVSNIVAPELNVDSERKSWLKKQGKNAAGLSESDKGLTYEDGYKNGRADKLLGHISKIALNSPHHYYAMGYHDAVHNLQKKSIPLSIQKEGKNTKSTWTCRCGNSIDANTSHPRIKSGVWKSGSKERIFCRKCRKNEPHTLNLKEAREMQASGVFETDESVSCPSCGGNGKKEGKDCSICKGQGKLTRDAWEKHYGNPATVKKEAQDKTFDAIPIFKVGSDFSSIPSARASAKFIEEYLKAPFVSVRVSTLGGEKNVSILVTVSLDEKKDWANGILHNSRFMMFNISNKGVVDQHSSARKLAVKFRKIRVKSMAEAVSNINKYISSIKPVKEATTK